MKRLSPMALVVITYGLCVVMGALFGRLVMSLILTLWMTYCEKYQPALLVRFRWTTDLRLWVILLESCTLVGIIAGILLGGWLTRRLGDRGERPN
jgi:hypothetical protein